MNPFPFFHVLPPKVSCFFTLGDVFSVRSSIVYAVSSFTKPCRKVYIHVEVSLMYEGYIWLM